MLMVHRNQLDRNPRGAPPSGKIQHIHPAELKTVIVGKVKELVSLKQDDLVTEVARSLGLQRTGQTMSLVLNESIRTLMDETRLKEDSSGNITLV